MEINEALDAIQTLVHCQGISREHEALETIRAALVVVQNSSHNNARDEMPSGCYGCIHLYADQGARGYPCRGCIRVRRTDLFDVADGTSPVA